MAKFTVTATIVFEVEAVNNTQHAAEIAYSQIERGMHKPENIQVWDEEPCHWFADRYTYANPPVFIDPNPQGPQTLNPVPAKVPAKETDQLGSIA